MPSQTPPQEVSDLEKTTTKDTSRAKHILKKLAHSKKVWYTITMLALAGAGYGVVKRMMKLYDLKGLGPIKIDALARVGRMLGITKTKFTATRLQRIEAQGNALLEQIRQGTLPKDAALHKYMDVFTDTDPQDVKEALWASFAVKADAIGSWFPLPHRKFLGHAKHLQTVLKKYSL